MLKDTRLNMQVDFLQIAQNAAQARQNRPKTPHIKIESHYPRIFLATH
ncbi:MULTISPECIES: hypothetical protein [unclassified Helicobacter]|nr:MULTISPECIES: hypothetical protein [unclassified Helicobacter]